MSNIQLENEVIVLSLETVSKLIDLNSDSATLYLFYHKTSKLQKTNSIWATNTFAMKGLKFGRSRFYKAKKVLQELGLIEEKKLLEKGKIKGHFLIIKYLKSSKNHSVENTQCGIQETNALSSIKENALSSINKNNEPPKKINNYQDLKTFIFNNESLDDNSKLNRDRQNIENTIERFFDLGAEIIATEKEVINFFSWFLKLCNEKGILTQESNINFIKLNSLSFDWFTRHTEKGANPENLKNSFSNWINRSLGLNK